MELTIHRYSESHFRAELKMKLSDESGSAVLEGSCNIPVMEYVNSGNKKDFLWSHASLMVHNMLKKWRLPLVDSVADALTEAAQAAWVQSVSGTGAPGGSEGEEGQTCHPDTPPTSSG